MEHLRADYDSPWKEILDRYFKDFMAFFFPRASREIDWTKGYAFLDKELQRVIRDAEIGRRLVDKLVKVWKKDGSEAWVLIHIEIQGNKDPEFARRMYVYNYRLFDRYARHVASLAILADDNKEWRPTSYGYKLWGSHARLEFPVVKLIDYAANLDALYQTKNPFGVVVMAHLKALETRHDSENRLNWKLKLAKHLYAQGFVRQDIIELFRFIDWVMVLPEGLEHRFSEELMKDEEEKKMRYITSVERIGIQKGIQKGIQQTIRKLLLNGLAPDEIVKLLDIDMQTVLTITQPTETVHGRHKKILLSGCDTPFSVHRLDHDPSQ